MHGSMAPTHRLVIPCTVLAASLLLAAAPAHGPRIEAVYGGEVATLNGYDLVGSDGEVVRQVTFEAWRPYDDEHGRWTGETRFEAAGLHVAKTELRTLVEPRQGTQLPLGTRRNLVTLDHAGGSRLFELRDVAWFASGVAGESGDVALLARSERGLPATPDELRVVARDGKTVRLELREAPRTLWNARLSPRGTWLAYTLREPNGGPPLAVRAVRVENGERFELPARDDLRLADFDEIDDDGGLWLIEEQSVERSGKRELERVRHLVGRASVPPAPRRTEEASAQRDEGGLRWGNDTIMLRVVPGYTLVTRQSYMRPEPAAVALEKIAEDVVNTVSLHDAEGRTLFEQRGVRYVCHALGDDGDANVCVESQSEGGCLDGGWRPGVQPEHDVVVVLGRDGAIRHRFEERPTLVHTDRTRISRNGRWLAYLVRGPRTGPDRQRVVVVDLASGARHEIPTWHTDRHWGASRISDDGDLLDSKAPGPPQTEEDWIVVWQRPR
jgi:hypothetical protein